MNFEHIRKDFPIFFSKKLTEKKLVYLDSAATYQKPQPVVDAMTNYYASSYASVHRAFYHFGEEATKQYEQTRADVATFINAQSADEIVFTKGTTEGINFIASSWAANHLKQGDEILLSQVEHHANLLPWQRVAQQTGALLKFIPLNTTTFTLEYNDSLITSKTKLVAVTHSSNVLGNVWGNPATQLHQLITQAHKVGARVFIDAAQSVAHQKIDIQQLKPDFLVFSGHKLLAPTGVGILYIKKELHNDVEPYQLGGSMIHSAAFESAIWGQAPRKFEAGTPPIGSILGLGAAITYLNEQVNYQELAAHETKLSMQLLAGLEAIEGVYIAGNKERMKQHAHLMCFSVPKIHPHDLASFVGATGIAVRAGHHCAQPLVNLLGADSLLRVSFGMYNTQDDVTLFLNELNNGIAFFKSASKR